MFTTDGRFNALSLSHHVIGGHVREGELCIDATAGRGGDTVFLCECVGASGKVIALDIQDDAVSSTRERVAQEGFSDRCEVCLDSHANLLNYAAEGEVSCITFNLGWLPGGDHSVFTLPDTSMAAIEAGLRLLKPGGLMSICIYYGGANGFEERDRLLDYFKAIDYKRYSVLVSEFVNRPGCPSIPVFIFKDID